MKKHRTKFLISCLIVLAAFGWVLPSQAATITELQAQISNLISQATALQSQLLLLKGISSTTPASCAGISFSRPLRQGSFGNDVKCLQAILNQSPDTRIAVSGAGSLGHETYYFGYLTKLAVIKFQNKYTSEILTPIRLIYGTGIVGAATIAKLNVIISVSITIPATQPVTPPTTGGGSTVTPPPATGDGGGSTVVLPPVTGGGDGSIVIPVPATDTAPPARSNSLPSSILAAGTTQATISLSTNELATCKYGTVSGTAYASMTGTFTTTGRSSHSKTITGITNGSSYTYYVRCIDSSSNVNTNDFTISFSVSSPSCIDCGLGTPIINPTSPLTSQTFTMTCPANASGYDCIDAYANGSSNKCTFGSYSGNNAIFSCTGLTAGTYTSKCVANTGTSRNCCASNQTGSYTVQAAPDTTPPSQITNLSASNLTQNSVTLTWTAPGDDGTVGKATSYDVRYSTASITSSNWTSATAASGEPTPLTSGTSQTLTVSGLTANTTYYFSIKAIDDASNISTLSNIVSGKTLASTTADTTAPTRSSASPTGTLAAGTTQATISLSTNESATCKYGTVSGTAYASIANTFTTTGGTTHSKTITGLTSGTSYTYYVRCIDLSGNTNASDFSMVFSIGSLKNTFSKKYILYPYTDLNVQSQITRLKNVISRAAAAGYNGIVLGSGTYNVQSYSSSYIANVTSVVDYGKQLGVTLIPYYFSQDDPLTDAILTSGSAQGKNELAEAVPVVGAKFVAEAGTSQSVFATARTEQKVTYPNAGFEDWNTTTGILNNVYVMDKATVFQDKAIKHSGTSSVRIQDTSSASSHMGRVMSNLITVLPFRTYTFSVWLKTENVSRTGEITALVHGYTNGANRMVIFSHGHSYGMDAPVSATQDWTQYKIVFNSLNNNQIRISLGLWTGITGKVWFDDVSDITELGLYKTVRRSLMPVTVKSSDGTKTFKEGTDYTVQDQKLSIPSGSAITAGSSLKVSWYQLADMIDGAAPASACQESFYTYFKKDIQRLNSLFKNPPIFFVNYDEWRVGNWDPNCKNLNGGQDMTGGQYMAYAMTRTEQLIKEIRPDAEIIVWNDMFDPFNNSVPNYFSVKGSVEGSESGVSSNIIIGNWNYDTEIDSRTNETRAVSSLKFWNNRGNHQILGGYYDGSSLGRDKGFLSTLDSLEGTSNGISGIDGYMYCTWITGSDGLFGEYKDIEAVANLMKSRGRWGN